QAARRTMVRHGSSVTSASSLRNSSMLRITGSFVRFPAPATRTKEPLKNSPIHRLSVYGVSRGEKAHATANFGGADRIREVRAEDEAGAVSRRDGTGGAVGGVTGAGGTALSEGRERAASGRTEPDVAGVLSAAVVQPERSGGGGCAV